MNKCLSIAFAALLAAGLHGIEGALPLEPAFVGDAYGGATLREIPKTRRPRRARKKRLRD